MTTTTDNFQAHRKPTDPHELVPRFLDLYNAGDMDGVAALYAENGQVASAPGDYYNGHGVIRSALAAVHLCGFRMRCKPLRMHITGNVALSSHELVITNVNNDDADLVTTTTEIARRGADGIWRIDIDDPYWLIPDPPAFPRPAVRDNASTPEAIVPLFMARYAAGDMDGLAELYAENVLMSAGPNGSADSRYVVRATFSMLRSLSVEMSADLLSVHAVGDTATTAYRMTLHRCGDGGTDVTTFTTELSRRGPDGGWRIYVDDPFWLLDS